MKKETLLWLGFLITFLLFSCSSIKSKAPIKNRIDSFVGRAEQLSEEHTTPLIIGSLCYVQLKVNSTTGYSWNFKISNTKKLALVAEDVFKKVFDERKVGAQSRKVWKFKAIEKGTVQVTFKYYRRWLGEKTASVTKTYKILIQ